MAAKKKKDKKDHTKPSNPVAETTRAFTVVQLVAIDETGDSYYRMRWPGHHLASQAPDWRILNLDARAAERFEWGEAADLLVVYQSHDLDLLPMLKRRREAGKKTLTEYNDNFYAPPPATPVATAWSSPLLWQSYERFMHECDGIIVTGPGLQELFTGKFSPPIHILENHIPRELPEFETLWENPENEIRIGLAGSLGHMSDYIALLPTIRLLFERFPQLILHVMGNETLPGIIGLPEGRLRYTPWGSMQQYYDFWRPLHLGIAPLMETPYNRCRSDVKALEMASCGVLPVLTRARPYEQFLSRTGAPVFSSFSELSAIVERFTTDPTSMRDSAKRAFEYVKAERIGPRRMERYELYKSHLPPTPGEFPWPQKLGCHELKGRLQDQTQEGAILAEAQQLLQQKRTGAAFERVQKALSDNPWLSGVALAELKILASTLPPAEWNQRYDSHRVLFPEDLRFPLLRVRNERSVEGILAVWNEIQSMLERGAPAYREFFGPMVVATLADQLPRVAPLVPIGEFFSGMFGHFAQLHFVLAQCYERLGEHTHALRHCRWLVQARELDTVNEKFFQSFDRAFLRTWAEGLEGRIEMSR